MKTLNLKAKPFFIRMSLVLMLTTSFITLKAQVSQTWLERYDFGGTSDIAVKLVTDDSANVYVTGYGGPLGNSHIITLKYNVAGQLKWTQVWNGPGNSNDAPNAMVIKQGALFITGFTESSPLIQSNRRKDFATLKYDLDGNLLWAAYYNYSPIANWEDIAYALDVDMTGNVYVTGSSKGAMPQNGYRDIATVKYDLSGIEQWVVRYNFPASDSTPGTNDDIPVALHVDSAANVYVCGKSVGDTTGYDYVTLKYNTDGINIWTKRYTMPGNYADVPTAMKLDKSGNVYVTGASSAYAVNPALWYDFATIKYNNNGDTVWVRRFNSGAGPIPWDDATDLAVDDTGNVYVTGSVPSATTNGDDIYTIKYNAAGVLLWQSRWDSQFGFEDYPSRMKLDKAGNIYITGYSKSDGSTAGNDYVTLKLNNSGLLQWAQRYDGPNNTIDNAYDLALDTSGNVYVTGQSYGFGDDYVTIKYSSSSLPVKLSSFMGSNEGTVNRLRWKTATEQNNRGFDLQRSANGESFNSMAFIVSKAVSGSSSASLSYSFDDIKPLAGNNYYRLRQLDRDGKEALSHVILIKGAEAHTQRLIISPNPASAFTTIYLPTPLSKARVSVFDKQGRWVMTEQVVLQNNTCRLSTRPLTAGTYTVIVEDGMTRLTGQLIVLK